jgi:hypothetical protein
LATLEQARREQLRLEQKLRDLREEEEEELIMMEGRLTLMQQMNSFLKVGRLFST